MDDRHLLAPNPGDSETALLRANLELALRTLTGEGQRVGGQSAGVGQVTVASLEQALHTYGSIKHLLPKLSLSPGQRAPVEQLLQQLRAQIVANSSSI